MSRLGLLLVLLWAEVGTELLELLLDYNLYCVTLQDEKLGNGNAKTEDTTNLSTC